MLGEEFLGLSLTGEVPTRMGNRHRSLAPHGCYRCRGDEAWITIAVDGDEEWSALRALVADPALQEEAFPSAESRWLSQDRLDSIIEAWTMERTPEEAVALLQRAGVASMPVIGAIGLLDDDHLTERGLFQEVQHPVIGRTTVVGAPWRFDGERPEVPEPAPLLGQHNDYVLKEILGLSEDEIRELHADGALR